MKLDLEQIKAAALAAPTTKPVPEDVCRYDPAEAEAEGWNECHEAMTAAANPAIVLELVRQLELERGMRLQCAEDSQMHLDRALAAEARYRFVIDQAELVHYGRGVNYWTLNGVVFDQAGEQDRGDKRADITAAVDAGRGGAKSS